MSALSIGLGADVSVDLSDRFNFRMIHMPSYVLLGSSDFNYDNVLASADSNYKVTRNYQYSLGGSYKAKTSDAFTTTPPLTSSAAGRIPSLTTARTAMTLFFSTI